jgi:hypothetical protein
MPPRKTRCFNDSLWKTYVVASSGLLRKHWTLLQLPSIQKGDFSVWEVAFPWVHLSGNVLSSLVRAVNVFCDLEKYDYFALFKISLLGVTTVDICARFFAINQNLWSLRPKLCVDAISSPTQDVHALWKCCACGDIRRPFAFCLSSPSAMRCHRRHPIHGLGGCGILKGSPIQVLTIVDVAQFRDRDQRRTTCAKPPTSKQHIQHASAAQMPLLIDLDAATAASTGRCS